MRTVQQQKPALEPNEYWNRQISEEMLEKVLEATNQHWHQVMASETPYQGFPRGK